jgi:RAB protein geranylgeranyltransferase component A
MADVISRGFQKTPLCARTCDSCSLIPPTAPILHLHQLYQKFRGTPPPTNLGRDRDYAVDLIPKFILANGLLTRILVHTDVVRYLEFKQIAGSFVYRDGRISKVPSTEMEALKSSLMGLFEKRRARNFFQFLQNWRDDDPTTHQGACCRWNVRSLLCLPIRPRFDIETDCQVWILTRTR